MDKTVIRMHRPARCSRATPRRSRNMDTLCHEPAFIEMGSTDVATSDEPGNTFHIYRAAFPRDPQSPIEAAIQLFELATILYPEELPGRNAKNTILSTVYSGKRGASPAPQAHGPLSMGGGTVHGQRLTQYLSSRLYLSAPPGITTGVRNQSKCTQKRPQVGGLSPI